MTRFPRPGKELHGNNRTFVVADRALFWNQRGKVRSAASQDRLITRKFLCRWDRREKGRRKVSPSTARWERRTGRRRS